MLPFFQADRSTLKDSSGAHNLAFRHAAAFLVRPKGLETDGVLPQWKLLQATCEDARALAMALGIFNGAE
jgi:hypothetical protein